MEKEKSLVAFQEYKIRRFYDEKSETWYFSVTDVVGALTESANPAVYWRVLKKRLKDEGANETVTKCNALKMPSADGKMRLTDMADTETLLRLIQSIPSPKAEPFKQWLAKVGYERIRDMSEAELIFTALAELSTRQIAESVGATGMPENAEAGRKGGKIAKRARRELESKTGKNVVTGENFLPPGKSRPALNGDDDE